MIAPMKWRELSLQGVKTMRRMQWMLSMLAVAICLYSVASIHSHDDGLYALDSACISCDLENVTSHSAAVSVVPARLSDLSDIEPAVSQVSLTIAATRSAAPIRAPPIYS